MVSDSAHPKMRKFLGAGEKTKISHFIRWFCVKDKLLGQKSERRVYCPDTDGLLKVSAQSEWWFSMQPPAPPHKKKNGKFPLSGRERQNFKFYWFYLSKR